MVPFPETVAATVNVVLLTALVTYHATPVAVPAFEISAAVKLDGLIASENTRVKLTGTEFVTVG